MTRVGWCVFRPPWRPCSSQIFDMSFPSLWFYSINSPGRMSPITLPGQICRTCKESGSFEQLLNLCTELFLCLLTPVVWLASKLLWIDLSGSSRRWAGEAGAWLLMLDLCVWLPPPQVHISGEMGKATLIHLPTCCMSGQETLCTIWGSQFKGSAHPKRKI